MDGTRTDTSRRRSRSVLRNDVVDFGGLESHVPSPCAKPASRIHGRKPLGKSCTLGLILGTVLTFNFQGQHLSVRKSDQEVRNVSAARSAPEVVHLEPEMIVLAVGGHFARALKDVG